MKKKPLGSHEDIIAELKKYISNMDIRIDSFKRILSEITKEDNHNLIETINKLSDLLIKEEASIINGRKLFLYIPATDIENECEIYSDAVCDALIAETGFKLKLIDNETWHIITPMLPNNQSKKKSKWFGETMPFFIKKHYEEYKTSNKKLPKTNEAKYLLIIHHYDKNSNASQLVDIDNYDIKTFIDALDTYLISSDSVKSLSVYMTGKESDSFYTEAYLTSNPVRLLNLLTNINGII